MDKKVMNTTIEFEFCDGTKTELTLAFIKLYELRAKNKAQYEKYSKIMSKGTTDELETITVLYTAYLCAHLGEEGLLTEMEFVELCGSDRLAAQNAAYSLIRPKKQ